MDYRIDDLQINGLRLKQDKDLFCFGTDAVLLANFARPGKNASVLDIGTGNGIIPVLLSAKAQAAKIVGLEIQPACAALAKENVALNQLGHLLSIVQGDIKDGTLFPPGSFDYITCNPPYKPAGSGMTNPSSSLAIARHELLCTLGDIIARAAALLKPKGRLAMVHKPQRLAELLFLMKSSGIEPKRLQMVYPRANKAPCLVLVEGLKGGSSELHCLPPLTIYDEGGRYTAHINELYQKTI